MSYNRERHFLKSEHKENDMTEITEMTKPRRVRVNPSRSTCEEIIRRILVTENLENGSNVHFKTAMDFMTYFESLYPAGPALVKQVQRAIKSMDLAKDENGFFIIGKTKKNQKHEKELSSLLEKTNAVLTEESSTCETVFLETYSPYRPYLLTMLTETESLRPLYLTIAETFNGLLFFTKEPDKLKLALSELL